MTDTDASTATFPAGGRIFAVGDIHGCADKLRTLLARLDHTADDTLVFLGDYINRGPDSRGVIEMLLELSRTRRCVFLMGNHELALLEYARTGALEYLHTLRAMGVEATLASYGCENTASLCDLSFLPKSHLDFLDSLQATYSQDGYQFNHAGNEVDPQAGAVVLDQQLTARNSFLAQPPASGEVVVFGHTAFEMPLVGEHRIGIDTGAVEGNLLTALELPGPRFHHA